KAGLAQSLKSVRRCAGLEGAATKNFCAGFGDAASNGENLLAGFDRARPGSNHDFRSADFDATSQIDDGAFGSELAAGELEWLRDAHDFAHTFEQLEVAMIEIAVHADCAKNRVRFARRAVHVEPAGDQSVDDMLDLGFRGPFLHHNNHE